MNNDIHASIRYSPFRYFISPIIGQDKKILTFSHTQMTFKGGKRRKRREYLFYGSMDFKCENVDQVKMSLFAVANFKVR